MRLTLEFVLCVCVGTVITLGVAGCRDRSDAPKARVLKGRVTQIDTASGVVTGSFWNEKQQDYMELKGKLAPDAEIMIDGRTATLDAVRIDDPVEVTGWEEKQGTERRLIASRVEVNRHAAGTQPAGATRPAGPSTAP